MGYVVQNIHGVIAVNDEATLNEQIGRAHV